MHTSRVMELSPCPCSSVIFCTILVTEGCEHCGKNSSPQAGSGFGFLGGLISRWRSDVAEALSLVDRFPVLIEHHVRMNSDGGRLLNCGQTFTEWAADLPRNPRKQGKGCAGF